MQSCLEKRGIKGRHEQTIRSDYNRDNQYSATHPDALSTGDAQGKGTGSGGHGFTLPNCNGPIGAIDYSNFDTNPDNHAGNNADNAAREAAMVRSIYNAQQPYSARLVDTTANLREGQYRVS